MLYKVAALITEVPEAGDMGPRCKDYLYSGNDGADIIIRTDLYRLELYPNCPEDMAIYLESGRQFYVNLLKFDGLMLHASAVVVDGKAYLFSGPSGMGKSTHTGLWKKIFGDSAQIINDDKPALRKIEGKWYACGTPWCGKDGINQNRIVPLAGICFLKQSSEMKIVRLTVVEAMKSIFKQTIKRRLSSEEMVLLMNHVDQLVKDIPVFELENRPEPEAARLSYETMRRAAEELGL